MHRRIQSRWVPRTLAILGTTAWLAAACKTQPPPAIPLFQGSAETSVAAKPTRPPIVTNSFTADAVILPPDPEAQGFGAAIAVAQHVLVVGAPQTRQTGAAWVFETNDLSKPPLCLLPPPGLQVKGFGASVAIEKSSHYIVIGAPASDVDGLSEAGRVFVWRRDGSAWTFVSAFQSNDPLEHSKLGSSVAINQDSMIAGAPWTDIGSARSEGLALAWVRDPVKVWHLAQQMKLATTGPFAHFGNSIACVDRITMHNLKPISEALAVVGSPGAKTTGGSRVGTVSIFRSLKGKWRNIPTALLVSKDPESMDQFGWSVAVHQELIAAGAPNSNLPDVTDSGSAQVFRQGTDLGWREECEVHAFEPQRGSQFGFAVGFSKDRLVVGAPHARDENLYECGRVFSYYAKPNASGYRTAWEPFCEIRPAALVAGGRFGACIAATDELVAVSEPLAGRGRVHLFRATETGFGIPSSASRPPSAHEAAMKEAPAVPSGQTAPPPAPSSL